VRGSDRPSHVDVVSVVGVERTMLSVELDQGGGLDAVILDVLHTEECPDYGQMRLARPALSPDERLVVWEGLPPLPGPEEACLAPVVLTGEVQGRRAYAERVPRGLRLSEVALPRELSPWVVSRVFQALLALRRAHQVHGAIGPDRVVLGVEGEVVLFGRGRRGGIQALDTIAASALLPEADPIDRDEEETLPGEQAALLALQLAEQCRAGDRERLAAWVAGQLGTDEPTEQLLFDVTAPVDQGADEVVPDIGPDSAGGGLLDPWASTTGSASEQTAEVTDGGGSAERLALSLGSRLAAPSAPPPPPGRFDAVQGIASRGVRQLVSSEPPPRLPAPLDGAVTGLLDTATPGPRRVEDPIPPGADDEPTQRAPVSQEGRGPAASEVVIAVALLALVVWAASWILKVM